MEIGKTENQFFMSGKEKEKSSLKNPSKRWEIGFPFRWIKKEILAAKIGKIEKLFFMSGEEKENRSLKNPSRKEGKLVFRFGG